MPQVKAWYKIIQGKPRKVERDLFWYDIDQKKMITYKGGKLLHTYGQKENGEWGTITKVVDVFEPGLPEVDSQSVEKWYQTYCSYNDSKTALVSSLVDSFIFNVPDEELDDFVYAMDREQIKNMVI